MSEATLQREHRRQVGRLLRAAGKQPPEIALFLGGTSVPIADAVYTLEGATEEDAAHQERFGDCIRIFCGKRGGSLGDVASHSPISATQPGSIALALPDGRVVPQVVADSGMYIVVRRDGLYLQREARREVVLEPICRFIPVILRHRLRDDGIETVAEYEIAVYHESAWHQVFVSVEEFLDLKWVLTNVGPTAMWYPKCRDQVVAATQLLSADVHSGPVPLTTTYATSGGRGFPTARWCI